MTVRKLLYPLVKGECTLFLKQKCDEFLGYFLSGYIETDTLSENRACQGLPPLIDFHIL